MHSTSVAMIFLAISPGTAVQQVTTSGKISHELPEKSLSLFPYFLPRVFQHSAELRVEVVITSLLTEERL